MEMWSPSGEETKMDEFRKRVNNELKLTLSEFAHVYKYSSVKTLARSVARAV